MKIIGEIIYGIFALISILLFKKEKNMKPYCNNINYIKEFDEIIKNEIAPLAKNDGFKKQGLNFSKKVDDIFVLFNFQKNKNNNKDNCYFFINLGIYSPLLREVYDNNKINDFPKTNNCEISFRIEDINKESPNEYKISSKEDLEKIKDILIKEYKEVIYPFLSKYKSINDMKSDFENIDISWAYYITYTFYLMFLNKDNSIKYLKYKNRLKKSKYYNKGTELDVKKFEKKFNIQS